MKICPSCLERFPREAETCPRDGTDLKDIQARSDDELVGRVLEGRWVIDELVGRGGMGTVYKGRQRSVDRTVAIKVLRTDLSYKEDSVERFFREANLAANINNPNCVTIFDFGQSSDGQVLYLAMEYLEGESLLERSRRAPLTYDQLCRVAEQICSALTAFHDEDVVHRDLKPENIFLVDDESAPDDDEGLFVKVFDFGIAKSLEEESRSVTQTGDVIGTPPFMSPEQCSGEELDPRSDLYALGCILFEQLSGRVPFTGDSAVDLLISHAHRTPPQLDQLAPQTPKPLVELVHELLEKVPADRPQTAESVRGRLASIREGFDETTRSEKTVGTRSGNTATQRAVDSEASTKSIDDPDFETIAELGYVPDDVEGDGAVDRDESRLMPVWLLVAALIVVVGGAVGWYGGWLNASTWTTGDVIDKPDGRAGLAGASDVGGARGDAGEAGRIAATETDTGSDVEPGVRETLEALRQAKQHAGNSEDAGKAPPAEEPVAESEQKPQKPTEESRASSDETSEADNPLAKFPVLTGDSAAAIFETHTSDVRECFQRHLGETPEAEGDVQLRVVVNGGGGVDSASIAGGSIESENVRRCVKNLANDWQFPPTQSGNSMAIRHTYGFKFRWQ